jgi:hypothetical protein
MQKGQIFYSVKEQKNQVPGTEGSVKGKAEELFESAFSEPRNPRSGEYKAGVLAALWHHAHDGEPIRCPYASGTAQADAWFAGVDEGHSIWRESREPNSK